MKAGKVIPTKVHGDLEAGYENRIGAFIHDARIKKVLSSQNHETSHFFMCMSTRNDANCLISSGSLMMDR